MLWRGRAFSARLMRGVKVVARKRAPKSRPMAYRACPFFPVSTSHSVESHGAVAIIRILISPVTSSHIPRGPSISHATYPKSQRMPRLSFGRPPQVSKSHLRIVVSAEFGARVSDLGSKHGAVITKPAPPSSSSAAAAPTTTTTAPARATSGRPAGLGGKNPPNTSQSSGATGSRPSPQPPRKQKFFPIPIPREPEWVAGAHGDRISLGKTVMVLEREGGPEPPHHGRRQAAAPMAGAGTGGMAATGPARRKPAAVISKGFAVNPNLVRALFVCVRVCVCFRWACWQRETRWYVTERSVVTFCFQKNIVPASRRDKRSLCHTLRLSTKIPSLYACWFWTNARMRAD